MMNNFPDVDDVELPPDFEENFKRMYVDMDFDPISSSAAVGMNSGSNKSQPKLDPLSSTTPLHLDSTKGMSTTVSTKELAPVKPSPGKQLSVTIPPVSSNTNLASVASTPTNMQTYSNSLFPTTTQYYPDSHFSVRLHNGPKSLQKKDKGNIDTIVSDLPTESVRWMKKRRSMTSGQRVVLSYIREKQLREMFDKLDFNHSGAIDLEELTEAVSYVQSKTKHSKGLEKFQNVHELFAAMDDNGDGTVDYQEFTRAMAGTSQSTFDQASEYDVDKLFGLFIEYGENRQRQLALTRIRKKSALTNMSNKSLKVKEEVADDPTALDMNSYQQFKILFGHEDPRTSKKGQASGETDLFAIGLKTSKTQCQLLDKFVAENQQSLLGLNVGAEESMLFNTVSTVTGTALDVQKEQEYMKLHEKFQATRKIEQFDQAKNLGIIVMQSKLAQQRRCHTAEKGMRNANSLPDLSRPTTSTGQRGVSISSESKVRNDMNFRQQARKEAYSILRDNSHRGGSFMNSVEEEAVAEMPSILPILKQKGGINFNASSASGTEHGAFPAHLTRASFIFS